LTGPARKDLQRWSARVDPAWSLQAWRAVARAALQRQVTPPQLDWLDAGDGSLLDAPSVLDAPLPVDAGSGTP